MVLPSLSNMLSVASLFSAMLQDSPKETAKLLGVSWLSLGQESATPDSCLVKELAARRSTAVLVRLRAAYDRYTKGGRKRIDLETATELSMSLADLVQDRGYSLDTHEVPTGNGWIVKIHRLMPLHLVRGDRVPVLVTPFLLGSSTAWLTAPRNSSLVYSLADRGFDVWLGNYRGNSLYSKVKYQDLPRYPNGRRLHRWAFTVNDYALTDIPSQIAHITNVTGHQRLHVVGMSQGAISLFQMFMLRPEMNEKVYSFASLAGALSLDLMELPLMRYLMCLIDTYLPDPQEILPYVDDLSSWITGADEEAFQMLREILGMETFPIKPGRLPVLAKHVPTGTSTLALRYYRELSLGRPQSATEEQTVSCKAINGFNYGVQGNLMRFGTERPAKMHPQQVTVPTKLYFSSGDRICTEAENRRMLCELPDTTTEHMFIDDSNFSHFHFAFNDYDNRVFQDVADFLASKAH